MWIRFAVLASAVVGIGLAVSPAQAVSMQECSIKYKAAQDAGTLGGAKWADFRRANCDAATGPAAGIATDAASPAPMVVADAAAATAVTVASKPAVAAAAATAKPVVPPGLVLPTAIASKYASQKPSLARLHTCLDQYHIDKANKTLGTLRWIQKGGGYYSLCAAKLKG
jgi:hypothetical protein